MLFTLIATSSPVWIRGVWNRKAHLGSVEDFSSARPAAVRGIVGTTGALMTFGMSLLLRALLATTQSANISTGHIDAGARHALERQALTDLASSTRLSGWAHKMNWLDEQRSVCEWDLVGCDVDGFVKLLTLDFNNLTGTLPASLGTLQSLQDLDLEFNSLSGPVPSSLGGLSSLVQLGLGGNAFSGSLPAELCPVLSRIQSSRGPKKPCDLSGSVYSCPLPCPELAVSMCRANCSSSSS